MTIIFMFVIINMFNYEIQRQEVSKAKIWNEHMRLMMSVCKRLFSIGKNKYKTVFKEHNFD